MYKSAASKTKDIARMGLFVALIIIGGFIKIQTPLVPITMQFVFCLLSGLILGGVKGSLCVIIYILMGLIGLPVFTTGGGFSYVLKPTFGYLIGFIIGTFLAGSLVNLFKKKNKINFWWTLLFSITALIIDYVIGVCYMYFIMNFYLKTTIGISKAIMSGAVMFMPTDIIWCVIASLVSMKLMPLLNKMMYLSKKKKNVKVNTVEALKEKVLNGYDITKQEALLLVDEPIELLTKAANEIRIAKLGNLFDFCSIINAKSGQCSEDCKFCAQSSHYNSCVEEYAFLSQEEILKRAEVVFKCGIKRFSIVTAGKKITQDEVHQLARAVKSIKELYGLNICASVGLITKEQLLELKEAGVDRIHNNLETSYSNFKNICTTHTQDNKLEIIKLAKSLGLTICSGGIFGVNESMEDRIDMAFELKELGVKSIPINMLSPIKNTPLENNKTLSKEEMERIVAIYRFILPDAFIRLAGGRKLMEDYGYSCFTSGANATITGDLLTTQGINILEDKKVVEEMGYIVNNNN